MPQVSHAEIHEAVQREKVYASSPQDEAHIRSRMRSIHGNDAFLRAARIIMDSVGAHTLCPRRSCSRAGGCRTRYVSCFWENLEVIQKYLYPYIDRHVRELQAAGLFPAPEEDAERQGKQQAKQQGKRQAPAVAKSPPL